MAFDDEAVEVQAQGWRAMSALHALIESSLEEALRASSDLSVVEYTVMDVLNRQEGEDHMRMRQLSRAAALSPSATTRLVNRLEARNLLSRFLCVDDRRGIYTELTAEGRRLLDAARPAHEKALAAALEQAREYPEMLPVVESLDTASGS